SHAEQQIHDSLNAPGRRQPAAPLPGSSRAKPRARLVPTLPEHIDLLTDLPGELVQAYRSCVRRFLVHLEEQGQSWSQLVPAGSGAGTRPAALEQAVNEGIRHHGLQTRTRTALNQAFGFKLRGDIKGAWALYSPDLQEHKDLLKDLPEGLDAVYRSNVKWFLVHLEEQGQSWSQLVPAGSGEGARPAALEQAVTEGIRHRGLQPNTRAAINQAFGFKLQGEKVRLAPDLQEHKDLLKDLPEELDQAYRFSVKQFLVHLEEQGQSWSQLVPAGSGAGTRPAALEQAVNEGIRHHGLRLNTRAAINHAFGFKVQSDMKKVWLAPDLQEHKDLLKDLPEELDHVSRSSVGRFLVHLEEQGQSWSRLVPAGSGAGARPAALEQAVNEGIRHHRLQANTRAAINRAFGLKLQSKAEKRG
ncbi:hypothetical protein, partial [Paraburkholderia humisilvae]